MNESTSSGEPIKAAIHESPQGTQKPQKEKKKKFRKIMDSKELLRSNDNVPENFEDILTEIGEWNRYQIIRALVILFPIAYICAAPGMVLFLSTLQAPQRCSIPKNSSLWPSSLQNYSYQQVQNAASQPNSCQFANLTEIYYNRTNQKLETSINQKMECSSKEVNYGDYNRITITTEFDLVCEKAYVGSLMMTVCAGVQTLGNILFISLSDVIGRKTSMFICLAWYCTFGLISAFMQSVPTITFFRSLVAMTQPSSFYLPIFLLLEFSGIRYRTMLNAMFGSLYGLTEALIPLVAYLSPSWRYLVLATVAPAFPLLLTYFWLDESPRWLLAKGRVKESRKILERVARENRFSPNRVPSEKALLELSNREKEKEAKEKESFGKASVIDLFRNSKLFIRTVFLSYCWTTSIILYQGLNLSSGSLGLNPYLVTAVMALIEIPGGLIGLSVETFGRVVPNAIMIGLSGIFSLIAGLLSASSIWGRVGCLVIAKMCITMVLQVMGQFAQELYPTVLRGQGQATVQTIASLIAMSTPFLVYAGRSHRGVTEFAFAFLGITSGCLMLFLPEFLGKPLLDTVEQVNRSQGVSVKSLRENIRFKAVRQHWKNLEELKLRKQENELN